MQKYKHLITVCLIAVGFSTVQAQDYDVSKIPVNLLKNANAVIRYSAMEIIIKNEGRAVIKRKKAITILNQAGSGFSSMGMYYDKFHDVHSFNGKLFDATGKAIKTSKKSEIKDVSGTSSSELADDVRYKLHDFNFQIYPFTVEYETSEEIDGLFTLPRWSPIIDENIALEKSILSVTTPLNYELRHKVFNYKNAPAFTTAKETKNYLWTVENMNAIALESYSAPMHEVTTTVFLAPTKFEIENFKGSMESWSAFGKFIYTLTTGKDKLPDDVKRKVHTLTDNIADPKERIRKLYDYMQHNTRYVSIQLGLGGWQPFNATSVAENGYGDCKALSNFMFSLLKEAGIKSFYTLISSGRESPILADFPSNQFNHAILCVPLKKDTMWLECTSQTYPAGYLGGGNSNRNALLIDETGGMIVRTPTYSKVENLQARRIISSLDTKGNLSMQVSTLYQAEQQDDVHSLLHNQSKESIEEYLKEQLSIPSYDVQHFEYAAGNTGVQSVREDLKVFAHNFATVSGKRIFITANILNRSTVKLSEEASRKHSINVDFEYTDTDSLEMIIPDGFLAENTPADVSLKTKYGTYTAVFSVLPGKIKYVRTMIRYRGIYPATEASSFSDFYKAIYKADRQRFVLVKKDVVATAN